MTFYADLHIHSHYSLATSKELTPAFLYLWGLRKGIGVIGTGDCLHPGWMDELRQNLEEAGDGVFRLREGAKPSGIIKIPGADEPYFLLSTEISNIYKKGGKVRKVHNVLLFPDFVSAERMQQKLRLMGFNITSDGRPILGLDSYHLLEIALEINPSITLIPAHIWTPWFSVLGASSGFDSVEECFGDLSVHIHTLETGLSSDIPMNRVVGRLDAYHLVSNSDAHSPDRLGRNANRFHCERSFTAMMKALKDRQSETVDLFPQEGKYHHAGHKKCGVSMNPAEAARHGYLCPVCGKKLTPGVLDRVAALADREPLPENQLSPVFHYIIPLPEILAQIHGSGEKSARIQTAYLNLLQQLGPELRILIEISEEEIAKKGGHILATAIRRMRNRRVYIREGYDGEYGIVSAFAPGEAEFFSQKNKLFDNELLLQEPAVRPLLSFNPLVRESVLSKNEAAEAESPWLPKLEAMAAAQQRAIQHQEGPAVTIAGPGSGKTFVLVNRIIRLIRENCCQPSEILAITFTLRAAREIRDRLLKEQIPAYGGEGVKTGTIHSLGLEIIREAMPEKNFILLTDKEKKEWLKSLLAQPNGSLKNLMRQMELHRNGMSVPEIAPLAEAYRHKLWENDKLDFEELVLGALELLRKDSVLLKRWQTRFRHILVDEFQDLNSVQYELIRLLAGASQTSLFAIGDPDQSIYRFRGAMPEIFSRLHEDFQPVSTYDLSHSYRCSRQIVEAASSLLGKAKPLQALFDAEKVNVVEVSTDASEAEYIARTIDQISGGTRFFARDSRVAGSDAEAALSDFAILCRTSRQFKLIIKALNDHGLPWQTGLGGQAWPEQTMAEALEWIRSHPEGSAKDALRGYLASAHIEVKENPEVWQLLTDIAESFGNDVKAFADFVLLSAPTGLYAAGKNAVHVMTLHASKGLEFDHVFIAGCEEGLLPYTLFESQPTDLEEERRLLYVGMTRARQSLSLCYARQRRLFNRQMKMEPSRFLLSLGPQIQRIKGYETGNQGGKQLRLF
ncbi:MAG: UvrD-helicase domain-containing protein [Bacteroidales bacterium]